MHLFRHLKVVVKHKWLVFWYSTKVGIPFRGLIHDTSKFSFTEFMLSAKYYVGIESPTINERNYNYGVSNICLHHTGRNKHHWQYWLDFDKNKIIVAKMPYKISLEFVCDMLSASKTYDPKNFSFQAVLDYYEKRQYNYLMHPATKEFVRTCFVGLRDKGFRFMKKKNTKELYKAICQKYDEAIFIPISNDIFDYVKIKG